MSQPQTKIDQIQIIGRRWFQRSYGNTYHSVKVFVNGKEVGYCAHAYGYGDQYINTAADLLVKAGMLKKGEMTPYFDLLEDKRNNPDKYIITVTDVPRERDLAFFEGKAY